MKTNIVLRWKKRIRYLKLEFIWKTYRCQNSGTDHTRILLDRR